MSSTSSSIDGAGIVNQSPDDAVFSQSLNSCSFIFSLSFTRRPTPRVFHCQSYQLGRVGEQRFELLAIHGMRIEPVLRIEGGFGLAMLALTPIAREPGLEQVQQLSHLRVLQDGNLRDEIRSEERRVGKE